MSGTAVKGWQQVVQQLEVLHAAAASGNTGLPFAAQLALLVHCNKQIAQSPSSSHATWEAIIHKEQVSPATALAAAELAIAATQDLSLWVQRVPAVYGSASRVDTNVLDSAVALMQSILPCTDGLVWGFVKYYMDMDAQGKGLTSANKAQLQSWAYQQCGVYLLLFAADALHTCRTSADASSSGSGSGGSSAAVPVRSDLEILQFALERHAQLPRAHTRLLQLLGSNAPFGVFASVLLRERMDVRKAQTWVVAYDTFMSFRQYLRLWPAQDVQQRQRETQLHEVMPVALLSWVNGMQQGHSEYLSVVCNSMRGLAHEVREEWAEDTDPAAATRGQDLPGTAFFEHHLQQAATGPVKDITSTFLLGGFLSLLLKPLPWLVQRWQQQLLLPVLPARGSKGSKGKGGSLEISYTEYFAGCHVVVG